MHLKKVLICSPSHAHHGGVETIINSLCRELPKRGWVTTLALGKGSCYNDVTAYKSEFPDLPIIEIDGRKGTRQGRIESLRKVIKMTMPDIVCSARIFDAYEVVALTKNKSHKSPRLAITIGGYEPHYLFDARLYRSNIDLCVVWGKLLAAACIKWAGLDEERVISIPGGIRKPYGEVNPRKMKKKLHIGYVGRLSGDKRALDIIPFVKHLEGCDVNYILTIVGEGPDEAEIYNALTPLINEGKVIFSKWKTQEELYRNIYPILDCLVNFSPTEGVPITPREAMTHGAIPVISKFVGLKSEGIFLHEENALTFPVGDIPAAVTNVKRLFTETGLIERLSTNAMLSYNRIYTFEWSMDAWAEAFNRCIEQPPMINPVVKLDLPPDGRLAKLGLSPWMVQRLRDFIGRKQIHNDPGSEWPTGSGMMTEDAACEIMQFAPNYEQKVR